MNKKLLALLIAVGVVFGISLVAMLLGMRNSEKRMVVITQDNQVIHKIDLNSAENQTIRVDGTDGSYNLITIRDGEIFMSEANCPDQTCVKMGALRAENLPIVCLPHKVVIRFAEEGDA
ncbi:MAG: NusG domain II-containing protein [Oscillospiraceae bacterium]|nr:NusG domain II-containing protein [Oscillospiraceae bacterium]